MNVENTVTGTPADKSRAPSSAAATAPASSGHATRQPVGGKLALGVGVALAFALADTRAAPLVMAVLAAGIIYQVLNL